MDKLMDNRWFIKVIALVLALLLYSAVPNDGKKTTDVNVSSDKNTETIQDIPVKSYYDTENLVISGVPDTVDVTIQGPMPNVQTAKALRNFEVYVDLSDIKIGSHTVPLKIKDISEKLEVQIDPAYANITVQEKVTKEFEVEAEYNSGLLEDGFEAERPVVEPSSVLITGAKDTIDRITYVKATLDIKDPFSHSLTREAKVRVLDRELNKLNVVVEPETVQVTIPIKSAKKTVPIKIVEKGSTPEGIKVDSIDLDSEEATIIGQEDLLKGIENVRVEVDLSQITDDTTVTLPVIISEGITKVSPQIVKAKIKVTKMAEKTFSSLTINNEGLGDGLTVEYLNPFSAKTDLTIYGPSEVVNNLNENDFRVFVDLSNLTVGNHDVDIKVNGPAEVNWRLSNPIAQVSITQKEA
ncbi:CdaR family protein [Neobacillus sp. D3-1R]|uniref:CdaR family protein n=1 Tax=Neobacillus sp. D3-1R TaxID=3445778 RepID=UPI003F9F5DB5